MGLSRKRQRELSKLKDHAEELWDDQKDVLDHASQVVREASRQAANYAREEVSPRVHAALEDHVKPAVNSGLSTAKSAVTTTREKLSEDVFPAVSTALGSAFAVLDVAKDPHVRDAIKNVKAAGDQIGSKAAEVSAKASAVGAKASKKAAKAAKAGKKAGKSFTKQVVKNTPLQKKSPGPGRYILIGIIVVGVAAVVYAAWQTLRADDDLWIDEEEALDATDTAGDVTPAQERTTPADDTV